MTVIAPLKGPLTAINRSIAPYTIQAITDENCNNNLLSDLQSYVEVIGFKTVVDNDKHIISVWQHGTIIVGFWSIPSCLPGRSDQDFDRDTVLFEIVFEISQHRCNS